MALTPYVVAFAPAARLDLLDIGDHIAQHSPGNAQRFVGKLTAQCRRSAGALAKPRSATSAGMI
ncbi:MAG: type II toxin-antitoxin system RelE/ParE family toxin [Ottowia sp.]|uniref:type II toxin-antitoxin system RelE/ParE family toxin n=1 Tax=Ottowia sp. TaxID=1898956 RepID=UPI0039E2974E